MLMATADKTTDWAKLADLAGSLVGVSHREVIILDTLGRHEEVRAELDVLETIVVFLHLLAERHRSAQSLTSGIADLPENTEQKARNSRHLVPTLKAEFFQDLPPRVC